MLGNSNLQVMNLCGMPPYSSSSGSISSISWGSTRAPSVIFLSSVTVSTISLSSCWILSSTPFKSFFILEYRLKRVFFTLIGLFCLWTCLPLLPSEKVAKSNMEINHRLCILINLLLLSEIDEGWRNPSKQSIFNESSNQI